MAQKVLEMKSQLSEFEAWKETDSVQPLEDALKATVAWEDCVKASQITDGEATLVKEFDKKRREDQTDLMRERGAELAAVFLKLIANVQTAATLKYTLALVDKLLTDEPTIAAPFFQRAAKPASEGLRPIMGILSRHSDAFVQARACHILSVLLSAGLRPALGATDSDTKSSAGLYGPDSIDAQLQSVTTDFVNWVVARLEQAKGPECLHVVSCLKTFLRGHEAQLAFTRVGGMKLLSALLRKDTQNTQLLYFVIFCIWLISFNPEVRNELLHNEVISKLMEVLKTVPRKKIVRITFSVLRNVLGVPNFNESMIACGLLKQLASISARKWADDDLTSDITVIDEALQKYVVTLSSFEKYHAELTSGHLEWTPVHNDRFFRENIDRFGEDNGALLKLLLHLLDSQDELTVEVACYDVGEVARFHQDGRRMVAKFDGKKKLMEKMTSANPKIAKQALLAVQKLMVHNWESLHATVAK